jgi:methyl-accepting chemotaxis protein
MSNVTAVKNVSPTQADTTSALDKLASGAYDEIPVSDEGIAAKIKNVARSLQGRSLTSLRALVSMSVNLNEAVNSAAEMIRDTREVDSRSQAIASAAEQLLASVQEITRNTQSAASEATQARETADQGVAAADKAMNTMESIASAVEEVAGKVQTLSRASAQIGEIIEQIDTIAKQTNLLALNATIEAARAGEAGKGFAVVASEVKSLSNQTTRATEDIRDRIDNLMREMEEIVSSMDQGAAAVSEGREVISAAGEEMRSMSTQVIGITDRMQEISGILNQQTEASTEVTEGITAIAGMTSNNVKQIETVVDFLAETDNELVKSLDDLLDLQIPDMTIYRAISDHVIWKKKLAEMIVGRARLKADELADHHQCRLGKWYDNASDPTTIKHPAFIALEKPHKAVHDHGIAAAKLYELGDLDGAMKEINQVATYSKDVVRFLESLISDRSEGRAEGQTGGENAELLARRA